MELEIKPDREGFESYIDFLDDYKKKDFPDGAKIDRETAWDLIGTDPFISYYNPNNDLRDLFWGEIILLFLTGLMALSQGISFDFSPQTLCTLTGISFFFFNLFRLLQRYELLKKTNYFTKNESVYSKKPDNEKKPSKLASNVSGIIMILYITPTFLLMPIEGIEAKTFPLIYLSFVVINLIITVCTSIFNSKLHEVHTYHPKDTFNYLIIFICRHIELAFWTYSGMALFAIFPNFKQMWIALVIFPLAMYVKNKLDTAYLIKKYLLEYQAVYK